MTRRVPSLRPGRPPAEPPARRTFGARRITRVAFVLLVAGVLLAAILGRTGWSRHSLDMVHYRPKPVPEVLASGLTDDVVSGHGRCHDAPSAAAARARRG